MLKHVLADLRAIRRLCDHDGKASGRLVLEGDGIRREIVCECGQVMVFLGRQEYQLDVGAARRLTPSWGHWRRSRTLLFSARERMQPLALWTRVHRAE